MFVLFLVLFVVLFVDRVMMCVVGNMEVGFVVFGNVFGVCVVYFLCCIVFMFVCGVVGVCVYCFGIW